MKRLLSALAFVLLMASSANAAFLDNCEAHFKLNTGALTTDSCGSNTLTNNNTVTEATGKLAVAGQFIATNSESLTIADNASLSTGDINYTVAAWVYFDTLDTNLTVGWKGEEWWLVLDATDKLAFFLLGAGGTNKGKALSSLTLSTGTWYFVVGWHDPVANKVYIQVNNGTVDEAATTAVGLDRGFNFEMGSVSGGTALFMNGRIDSFSFWKRIITSQERADLWNCDNALDHDFSATACNPRSTGIIIQ